MFYWEYLPSSVLALPASLAARGRPPCNGQRRDRELHKTM